MSRTLPENHLAVPILQVDEIVEVLNILANGQENATTQNQARLLVNALTNRLRDNQAPEKAKRIF